jgi:hypothetical protein
MSEPSVRGQNGGNARKEKLSPERRKEIGKLAAAKRWANKKAESDPTSPNYVSPEPPPINTSTIVDPPPQSYVTGYLQAPPSPSPPPVYAPPPPEPPKAVQKRRKPMVKEFGKAHSYAEKRLAEALKERAEAMGKVAMLNAEIPSLVQIIKALGMTPNTNGFQDFTAPIPNMNPYQIPPYQQPQTIPSQDINPIDPALYATNSNPLPGLAPAIANTPVVTNKPLGGAIDLDFTPTEDEGPPLPRMGGGWV